MDGLPEVGVCLLYKYFLSSRHLHFPAAVWFALASSIGLYMLSIIFGTAVFFLQLAVICLEIIWFCCRPAVVASSPSRRNRFVPAEGKFPSFPISSPKKNKIFREGQHIVMIFPAVYVAHTGYFDKEGLPIYGLYAAETIKKG